MCEKVLNNADTARVSVLSQTDKPPQRNQHPQPPRLARPVAALRDNSTRIMRTGTFDLFLFRVEQS